MKLRTFAKNAGLVLFGLGMMGGLSTRMPALAGKWRCEQEIVLQEKKDGLKTWKKQELLSIDRELDACLKVRSELLCVQKARSAKEVLEITAAEKDNNLTLGSVIAESPKLQENERNLSIFIMASLVSIVAGLAMFLFIPAKPKSKPKENPENKIIGATS